MGATKRVRQRGPKGDEKTPRIVLTMPDELRVRADKAAAKDGVTLSEWIRRAVRDSLLHGEARRLGLCRPTR